MRNCQLIFQNGCTILYPQQQCVSSDLFICHHYFTSTCYYLTCWFQPVSHSGVQWVVSVVFFICISLITDQWCQASYHGLVGHLSDFLEGKKCLFRYFIFELCGLYELRFFIYSRYDSLIRHMICKYFLPSHGMGFFTLMCRCSTKV